jgi:hypothetical protein
MKKVRTEVCKTDPQTTLIDVLDRVLDKGVVIDAWVRVSLIGIDLIAVDARVLVASIHTYVQYSDAIAHVGAAARPQPAASPPRVTLPETPCEARLEARPTAGPVPSTRRPAPARRRPRKVAVRCREGCTL